MRVLKTLLLSLLSISILAGLGFLVMREVLLLVTITNVKKSLITMRDIDGEQTYLTDCMSRGSDRDETGRAHHTQLRFVENGEYVVEVVCNQMDYDPIEVERKKLASTVKPHPGQSGIKWDTDAGLNFSTFKRTASISVIEGVIISSLKPSTITNYQGPDSACQSYSFQCCDQNTQLGRGKKINQALDCPQTCYETCVERPLILTFTTQPYYNRMTRTLNISANQPVVFSYLVTPNQNPDISLVAYEESDDKIENIIMTIDKLLTRQLDDVQVQVLLDYGDGETAEFTGMRGQVEHNYKCASSSCLYRATLKVVNAQGVESLDTTQNTIKIQIN